VNEPPIYRLVSLPAASHRSSPSEYLSDFGAGFGEVVYIHLAEINFYVFPGAEVYIPVCSPMRLVRWSLHPHRVGMLDGFRPASTALLVDSFASFNGVVD